jgi:hypothetical protein
MAVMDDRARFKAAPNRRAQRSQKLGTFIFLQNAIYKPAFDIDEYLPVTGFLTLPDRCISRLSTTV